jgi:hypothetical protein
LENSLDRKLVRLPFQPVTRHSGVHLSLQLCRRAQIGPVQPGIKQNPFSKITRLANGSSGREPA